MLSYEISYLQHIVGQWDSFCDKNIQDYNNFWPLRGLLSMKVRRNHLSCFLISIVALQKVILLKMETLNIKLFHSSSALHSSSLSSGQTVRVLGCFIVCRAVASFCASKSCVVAGAVSQAGRRLALARRELEKAFRCWCFCDQ